MICRTCVFASGRSCGSRSALRGVWGAKCRRTIFHGLVCAGRHYTQLVFLHPVGALGYIVYSGASAAQNVVTLFFILEWDRYGFGKKRDETHYTEHVFLHPIGYV
jgi:hypothetical protein